MSRFVLAISLFIAAVLPLRGSCVVPYWSMTWSTKGTTGYHLASADFNSDGKPDIAVADSNSIRLTLNNGGGTFTEPVVIRWETTPGDIVAADFNGDGKSDLAYLTGSSFVILPGNGDGTFAPIVYTPTQIAPTLFTVAKMNGDSYPDIVTIDNSRGILLVYTNNGSGAFTETSRTPTGREWIGAVLAADVDSDGLTDVVLANTWNAQYDFFSGTGSGTFEAPYVAWGANSTKEMQAVDVDSDGRRDLIIRGAGLSVMRNLGNRQFGDPLGYINTGFYSAWSIGTGDFTMDGAIDIVENNRSCDVASWTGSGIGTMTTFWTSGPQDCSNTYFGEIEVADFDADGRSDVFASFSQSSAGAPAQTRLVMFRNICGDSQVTLETPSPTISVNQSVDLKVTVSPRPFPTTWTGATGSVTLKDGDQTIATVQMDGWGTASIPYSSSVAGDRSLTVSYEGDAQYAPAVSAPLVQHVVAHTTTTTLTVDPPAGAFGFVPQLTAHVTSSLGDAPTGPIQFSVDGANLYTPSAAAPSATLSLDSIKTVGTYVFRAIYNGDATHPPSGATVTYTIDRRTVALTASSTTVAGANANMSIYVVTDESAPYLLNATGSVTVTENGTSLGTSPVSSGNAAMVLSSLAAGRHLLHVAYSGDSSFKPAERTFAVLVFAPNLTTLDARGTAAAVSVVWYGSNSAAAIVRRQPSGAWNRLTDAISPVTDTTAAADTVYLYALRAADNMTLVSNIDVGLRVSFVDSNLTTTTRIKAAHVIEVVTAMNRIRTAAGLAPLQPAGVAPGGVITAAQIVAIRNGINDARVALGAPPYSFMQAVASGAPIHTTHIDELREAIR
ncbi:MAG TPA: FG-GAP-like repeat-containing protein [Thermoanaerobaculia bacterium]|nr:FG-GAP-like repeat-containing protein [Thermoanaerobaculia bacterium]